MALSILIFLAYLVGTTFLIRDVMDWEADGRDLTFIDAFYFNFITLSTTGQNAEPWAFQIFWKSVKEQWM